VKQLILAILIILSLTSISYADDIKELCDKNVCLVAFDFGFGFGFGGGGGGSGEDTTYYCLREDDSNALREDDTQALREDAP
jgi:hypothetical protein